MTLSFDYEAAKHVVRDGAATARAALASAPDARPEMLYFLASDPDASVRAAVAGNAATPSQADRMLAADENEAVRLVLARRLSSLAPGLSAARRDRLARMAWDTLCLLAEDAATEVRAVVAEAAVGMADPDQRSLVLLLAHDAALAVCGPVLRACPLLTDADLLSLIAAPPTPETLTAIARRQGLAEVVADAIAATADTPAVAALLANPSAAIREATLDTLAAQAASDPVGRAAWHAPLLARPNLPAHAAQVLSECVAGDLLARLAERGDLDPGLRSRLQIRLSKPPPRPALQPVRPGRATLASDQDDAETAFLAAGAAGDVAACRAMLIRRADVPEAIVDRAMALRSGKALLSLSWRAGLSPRAAVVAQSVLGRVPPDQLQEAAPDGGWPLSLAEMRWHVDMLGRRTG